MSSSEAGVEVFDVNGSTESPLRGCVLVIVGDAGRRGRFEANLDFLGVEVRLADATTWRRVADDAGMPLLAALVSDCMPLQDVLSGLQAWNPNLPVVLAGDRPDGMEESVARQILGSVSWPLRYGEIADTLQRARQIAANGGMRATGRSTELFRALVGRSSCIQRIRALIEQVAVREATVLILGETGTGKEVVARGIHNCSPRRGRPFVAVNCGAIPADLLESELFGHEKGAFTGAISTRQGRFEMAQGGTLFLDEIGDMPLPMQVKLLRVLQERSFERVGSNRTITTDVRIIAATHRKLEEAIAEGRFREDLYYRLNVFPLEVPPLRERIGDLPLLVGELAARMEAAQGASAVRISAQAMKVLQRYPWPGNIRELANLIERLGIMYPGGVVEVRDLPEKFRDGVAVEEADTQEMGAVPFMPVAVRELPAEGLDLKEYLSDLEVRLIRQALDDSGGVVAHAAKLLGMRRTTLVEKMRKFGIGREDEVTEA